MQHYKTIICLCTCLLASPKLGAQNTAGFLVRDLDSAKNAVVTWHPILGYTPETRLAFGGASIILFKDSAQNLYNTVNPFFVYTLNKQMKFVVLANLYPGRHDIEGRFEATRFPQFFYGIGNSNGTQSVTYNLQTLGFNVRYLYQVKKNIKLGGNLLFYGNDCQQFDYHALTNSEVRGIEKNIIAGLGGALKIDARDNNLYAKKGYYLAINNLVYSKWLLSDYNMARNSFDARYYLTPYNSFFTMAFQFYNQVVTGKSIPFYLLPRIGGENRLRGINSYRFIDNVSMLIQGEGRLRLFENIGLNFFAGTGDVAQGYNNYKASALKVAGGFGIRLNLLKKGTMNLRADYGFSNTGDSGFYIGIGEVF
ncbi:MAG: BamA/TamA family outer membrane protein [Bacteroidales bacterium]|nr:BamA/TamA family outer membrane protein [Bacteroidales bacterium]